MIRSAEGTAREAQVSELKRLITAGTYETQEKLEEAVDAFLWQHEDSSDAGDKLNDGELNDADQPCNESTTELRRGHPK